MSAPYLTTNYDAAARDCRDHTRIAAARHRNDANRDADLDDAPMPTEAEMRASARRCIEVQSLPLNSLSVTLIRNARQVHTNSIRRQNAAVAIRAAA